MTYLNKLQEYFGKLLPPSNERKHSLAFLNAAQFLGVINDNVFKLVMAYLLIEALGYAQTSKILSATGAIYVIPFLLFSSSAGILADRFSKQKLLVGMKCAEVILMGLAIFAFYTKTVWGCFSLLFLISTHSALFGPSKYGIITEIVPPEKISRANGLITSFTYLAMIVGTFLASFLTDVTNHRFVIIAFICLGIAFLGLISALCINPTPSQGSSKKMSLLFIREIFYTLRYCRTIPHLLPAIFGSAFFLFIGGFTQLNIIPFAIQSLNLSEVVGGYLFLATALGIALGSVLAGKASRKRVELGLSCLAGFGIVLFLFLLDIFSSHLVIVIICLVAIGLLGGAFIVPFDTFIQVSSDRIKRGQTIAAANFLSFTGVLFASLCLYLFNQVFGMTSAAGFSVIGVITFFVTCALTLNLADLFFHYFSRKILKPLFHYRHPSIEELDKTKESILILEKFTWKKALLLSSSVPTICFMIPKDSKKWHWYYNLFSNIYPIQLTQDLKLLSDATRTFVESGRAPCLLLDQVLPPKSLDASRGFFDFFKKSHTHIVFAHLIQNQPHKSCTFSFQKKS